MRKILTLLSSMKSIQWDRRLDRVLMVLSSVVMIEILDKSMQSRHLLFSTSNF